MRQFQSVTVVACACFLLQGWATRSSVDEKQAQLAKDSEHLDTGSLAEGKGKPSPGRLQYVSEKLGLEREVVRDFVSKAGSIQVASSPGTPKVAFLFLTMKDLAWPNLWHSFFSDATSGDYSIYVHQAALKDGPDAENPLLLAEFGAQTVPWVKTAWCALFGVEVAILSAALADPTNEQFVFVSDSTVPLKNFAYVHRQLVMNSPTTSKFCLAEPAEFRYAGVEMAKQEAKRACMFRDYLRNINPRTLKHHQWAVLARSHAAMVVRHAAAAIDIYQDVWTQAAPDIDNMGEGCSDEAVPVIALLHELDVQNSSTGNTWTDLTRLGVEQNCLTYVRWRNCFGDTELDLRSWASETKTLFSNLDEVGNMLGGLIRPHMNVDFMKTNLKRELNGFPHAFNNVTEKYLRSMVNQGFMFARKFNVGLEVATKKNATSDRRRLTHALSNILTGAEEEVVMESLDTFLPKLWQEVDAEHAQAATWSRLETRGAPAALRVP
eukprot:TRINITY_DN2521_c0_g1_i1.p1 TRINITY_DN2521_c0_g1~~TRINITY_DN2521_c0_g1_i1.p1  ORF type:complete len:493 (-),score=92.27 TRINITY_DN2521_c0_g1_i1:124-1602(-)